MKKLTLKEKRQQYRKWYLMTNTPVPEYLKEENHTCNPNAYYVELIQCRACGEIEAKAIRQMELGKYR
jgi:hypothetical protein